MPISDQAKLGLLTALYLATLTTLFTSSGTFHAGSNGLPSLAPPTSRLCRKAIAGARGCESDGDGKGDGDDSDGDGDDNPSGIGAKKPSTLSSLCEKLLSNARRCEGEVMRAYRHINMGGCVREIQNMAICNLEWCDGVLSHTKQSKDECERECGHIHKELRKCEDGQVANFFIKAGMNPDGTLKDN